MKWFTQVVLQKYAEFDGRARRSEYWYFFLVNVIISFVLGFIGGLLAGATGVYAFMYIGTIFSLALLVPGIAVSIRRMHDVGKSGWYMLIPIYNLILACTEGDAGDNEYGPNPKTATGPSFVQ